MWTHVDRVCCCQEMALIAFLNHCYWNLRNVVNAQQGSKKSCLVYHPFKNTKEVQKKSKQNCWAQFFVSVLDFNAHPCNFLRQFRSCSVRWCHTRTIFKSSNWVIFCYFHNWPLNASNKKFYLHYISTIVN